MRVLLYFSNIVMKKTFECPRCGTYKTIKGRPGEKKIISCDNCGSKGYGTFPKKIVKKYLGLSKKQIAVLIPLVIVLMSFVVIVVMPTMNGDMHFLTVQSGSMEPKIHIGDVVVSTYVDPSSIKVGDVITFHYMSDSDPNRCFTHRVHDIIQTADGGYLFQTKGDANEDPDEKYVRPDEVMGRVSLVVPYIGYFGEFARSIVGFFVFLVIPAVLIIVFEVYKIIKVRREEKIEQKIRT